MLNEYFLSFKRQLVKVVSQKESHLPQPKRQNYTTVLLFIILVVLVAQSGLTLCDPTDCNLPGSSVHGILQARILEWVAISFSKGSSNPETEPGSPALQADSLPAEAQSMP